MKVRVLFFAILREKMQRNEGEFELREGETAHGLAHRILEPVLESPTYLNSLFFAVNQEYVAKDYLLKPGDELALIPPVAGG